MGNGEWAKFEGVILNQINLFSYDSISVFKSPFTIAHSPFTLQTLFSIHSLRHGFALLSPIVLDG